MYKLICAIILLCSADLSAYCNRHCPWSPGYPRFEISEQTWLEVCPHILPEDFKIKPALDALFSRKRVTLNADTLVEAGFSTGKSREFSHVVVTKHPNFSGYVFKIYLDDENQKPNDKAQAFFLRRIRGALAIDKLIGEHNLQHLFKVPKKWLYYIPESPMPHKKYSYKNFILIEEDMDILDKSANKQAWKSSMVSKETLRGLHIILKETSLYDGAKIDNIPFSKDGRVAFIDTESFGAKKSPPLRLLNASLNSKMRHAWKEIIH